MTENAIAWKNMIGQPVQFLYEKDGLSDWRPGSIADLVYLTYYGQHYLKIVDNEGKEYLLPTAQALNLIRLLNDEPIVSNNLSE